MCNYYHHQVNVSLTFVDLKVRVASEDINTALQKEVATFRDSLREGPGCGQVRILFYFLFIQLFLIKCMFGLVLNMLPPGWDSFCL